MHVNGSQASGNSSRSRSQSSWARSPCRGKGGKVPQWGHYGMRPILHWSGTDLNPDSHFMVAQTINYNTTENCWRGFFLWADGEDDESMVVRAPTETNQLKMSLGFWVSKLEAEKVRLLMLENLDHFFLGGLNPGVGMNLKNSNILFAVPELAPCIGSMLRTWLSCVDLLLGGSLSGRVRIAGSELRDNYKVSGNYEIQKCN
ncbi:hypothetical protein PIB30_073444 [Stylosanthes scabra]|uniref:Uncharacterized protein n=1 Tax=Stylosanthes scabra TaxID=79078 RepID=A0ABU6WMM0_9FABA|nr:hypothetical protein [Stylosanthes scabra]